MFDNLERVHRQARISACHRARIMRSIQPAGTDTEVSPVNQTLAFIVHLPVKHEHVETFRLDLLGVLDAMAGEADFVSTYLHQPADDPDSFVLYEVWSCSREHFLQHHLGKPYRQAFEAALAQRLRAERRIEFLDTVHSWHRQALAA
jgi:quinol monooxygenase YgiN